MQDEAQNEKEKIDKRHRKKEENIETQRWEEKNDKTRGRKANTQREEQQQCDDREQMNWFKADREQAVFAVASHLCSMCHFSAQCQLQPTSPVTASLLA